MSTEHMYNLLRICLVWCNTEKRSWKFYGINYIQQMSLRMLNVLVDVYIRVRDFKLTV